MNPILSLPDALPILTSGLGNAAAGKACAMSAVHWMEGGKGNSDAPACVHPVLRSVFISINDADIWKDDAHRTRSLWPLIARAMGTEPTGTTPERHVFAVRLAIFSARYVLPQAPHGFKQDCQAAIEVAERWCENEATYVECYDEAEKISRMYKNSSYENGKFALIAAKNSLYAAQDKNGLTYIYGIAGAAALAASSVVHSPVSFLTALLDEHDRLIQHQPVLVDLRGLDGLVPTIARTKGNSDGLVRIR